MSTEAYDVIIVGSGLAGHCAAIVAAGQGARVLMLEAEAMVGGASRWSTGIMLGAGTSFQRERGIVDDADNLFREYMLLSQYKVQPSVVRQLCTGCGPTIEWLAGLGVGVRDIVASGEESTPRGHITDGGQAIVDALEGAVQLHHSVDIATRVRVSRLLVTGARVSGVCADGVEVRSDAVVLAAGGVGASQALMAQYLPFAYAEAGGQPGYVGPTCARGDGVILAQQVGAEIVTARGSRAPTCAFSSAYLPSFAMVINQLGRRFFDETLSYGVAEGVLAAQPGAVGYLVFDESLKRSLRGSSDVYPFLKVRVPTLDPLVSNWASVQIDDLVTRGEVLRASSTSELARLLGVPLDALDHTLLRYNEAAQRGVDEDFLKDPKGLRPIETPPFYACELRLGSFGLTAVGPRIDHSACVIDTEGRRIQGLYAAGECVGGVMGNVYFGSGSSLSSAAVFGRVAGAGAAEFSRRVRSTVGSSA